VWFMLRPAAADSSVYLYDITLDEAHRGKGYGKMVMGLVESEARKIGAVSVRLHVFEHNGRARALYEKLSFRVTGHMMTKEI
jgi:ribosomal protein S18 acetylase RimI-like enzyme